MPRYTKIEIDNFYSIINNLIEREQFDKLVDDMGSRDIINYLSKGDVVKNMTIEQLKSLNEHKWQYMFISGTPHIDWKCADIKSLFDAFMENHNFKVRDYVARSEDGSWYENYTYWFIGDKYAIKAVNHRAKPFTSSYSSEWYYTIVNVEEAPEEPDMCVVALAVCNGRAYLHSQFTGSQKDCELWADKTVEKCNELKIRYIDIRNGRD